MQAVCRSHAEGTVGVCGILLPLALNPRAALALSSFLSVRHSGRC